MRILAGALTGYALLAALGWIFLRWAGRRAACPEMAPAPLRPPAPFETFALSFFCGMALAGLAGLWAIWPGARLGWLWWAGLGGGAAIAAGAPLAAGWRSGRWRPGRALDATLQSLPRSPLSWAFLALVAVALWLTLRQALAFPVVSWDPLSFWYLKTKILLREGTVWNADFLAPERIHFSRNYPILVNITEAGLCRAAGEFSEAALKGFLWLWQAAALLAAGAFVARRRSPAVAWGVAAALALIPAFGDYLDTGPVTGYRDAPLAWVILLAACLWLETENAPGARAWSARANWAARILLLALLIGCKREGAFWALGFGILMAFDPAAPTSPGGGAREKPAAPRLAAARRFGILALPFALSLPWFVMQRSFPPERSEFYSRILLTQPWSLTMTRLSNTLAHLPIELFLRLTRWGILWWLFCALALWRRGAWTRRERRLAALIGAWGAVVIAGFVFDPWLENTAHIAVSMDRLILQAAPLAVVLVALNLTAARETATPIQSES